MAVPSLERNQRTEALFPRFVQEIEDEAQGLKALDLVASKPVQAVRSPLLGAPLPYCEAVGTDCITARARVTSLRFPRLQRLEALLPRSGPWVEIKSDSLELSDALRRQPVESVQGALAVAPSPKGMPCRRAI